MSISKVQLRNFRSFHEASIELGKFNVVIGANASGKSNLIQFVKFLRDIRSFGIDDAISMQGGSEYVLNANHPEENRMWGRITSDGNRVHFEDQRSGVGLEIQRTCYEIEIEMSRTRAHVKAVDDRLVNTCRFFRYRGPPEEDVWEEVESLGVGLISMSIAGGKPLMDIQAPVSVDVGKLRRNVLEIRMFDSFTGGWVIGGGKTESLLEVGLPAWSVIGYELLGTVSGTGVYDIDPRVMKRAQPVTGRHDLEADGSNLAAVIRRLCKNPTTRRQIENVIRDLLPFVERVSTKKVADSVMIGVKERFGSANEFPAFLLSDGTLSLTALCVVLFFQDRVLKIIEEPERNIHPHLISKMVGLMREASEESQIITTTHNPEIVRHAGIDDLVLVSRNHIGDSEVSRPGTVEEVRDFLSAKLGIEELYIQNILERYRNSEDG